MYIYIRICTSTSNIWRVITMKYVCKHTCTHIYVYISTFVHMNVPKDKEDGGQTPTPCMCQHQCMPRLQLSVAVNPGDMTHSYEGYDSFI